MEVGAASHHHCYMVIIGLNMNTEEASFMEAIT